MEFGLTPVASTWHLHLPQGQASAYKGSRIDHGLSADAIEASAVSRRSPVLKPSSNSCLPIAWSTAPATDASLTYGSIQRRTIVETVDEIPIWVEASMAQGNQSGNFVLHTSNIDRINQLSPRFVPFGFACSLALRLGLTLGGVN